MARASKKAWLGMAMGVALGFTDPAAGQQPAPMEATPPAATAPQRGRGQYALNTAIECYRRGEYDLATTWFQQAQGATTELNEAQRTDLTIWVQLNTSDAKSRRDGSELIRQASAAMKLGRTQEAATHLNAVLAHHKYLAVADRQQYQLMEGQLRAAGNVLPPAMATLAKARTQLQQARMMLAQGNVDGAESLVREVDRMGATFAPDEDTPRRVMEDVTKARRARPATAANTNTSPAPSTRTTAPPTKAGNDSLPVLKGADVARGLMKQGRQALKAGDLTAAMKMATEARAYKQDLRWYDEDPEKLFAEVQKAEAAKKTSGNPASVLGANKSNDDPRTQVKQARELMSKGNLAEAEKVAILANAARGVRWGLFEDSPEKVLGEIRKASQKRDQEESIRLLAEAKHLFGKANGDAAVLAQALELTNKAERLHGAYSAWDMSDRPFKVRMEIENALARARRSGAPQTPSNALAQNVPKTPTPTRPETGMRQASHLPPPVPPPIGTFVADTQPAPLPLPPAPRLDVPPLVPITPMPAVPPVPVVDAHKQRVQMLLAEAKRHQQTGNLLEARRCVKEAREVHPKAIYGPGEESPETVLLTLSALANRQVDALMVQVNEHLAVAGADPTRLQKAEMCLTQARQMATAYGFDTQPIEAKMTALRPPLTMPVVNQTPVVPLPVAPPTVVQGAQPLPGGVPAKQRGDELLRQARMELNRGETGAARRLAVEAFTGKFGVESDAEKVLRTIDAEEFNQRIMGASRSYDAAVSALQRQDQAQALLIFRTIEPSLLPPEKQTKYREILGTLDPQMLTASKGGPPAAPPVQGQPVTQASAPGNGENYAQQVKALQDVKYQQLRDEGLRVMTEANSQFQAGHSDRALEILQDHLASLRSTQLDPQRIAMLNRPVEARLAHFKTMKAQRDFARLQDDQGKKHGQIAGQKFLAEENKNKQLGELMKQYQTFYKEGKYREAEMYAMRALEIDPDNAHAAAAVATTRIMKNQTAYTNIKNEKEGVFLAGMNDTEKMGPPVTSTTPISFDPATMERIKGRKPVDTPFGGPKNEREREIQRKLYVPINLEFKNSPLEKALSDLQEMTGVNIHLHREALREAGIAIDAPVTINVSGVSLNSALNLLLKDAGLSYVIDNEVLKITTDRHVRGKLITRTFPVADLVLPIENYSLPSREQVLRINGQGQMPNLSGGTTPHLPRNGIGGGTDVSPGTLGSGAGANNHTMTSTNGTGSWQRNGAKGTIEDLLIKLVSNTVAPNSWDEMGGSGHIEYFPLGMALVVNQTPDIQEQIAELLTALRRLQDQEVAIEVRFITIAESFFERIGLDFNVNFKTNNTRYEPQIVTQQFKPFGFINDFQPKSTVIGLTPAGSFTSDLDIPLRSSSFAQAIPPFGAFPNIPGGNGGIELGLAFLSDIQVFLFMEAAQGDQRTNVMQAPKLTLFNGQTATISIEDQQFFVTNVNVVQGGGQIVFVPSNQLVPIGGVTLTIQAVISADRRFVRMSMTPTLTNLASAVVQLFPITTFITPVFEGGAQGQPVPFTQFIQQPVINSISVNTTVAVPDGGTVLMGGLKRLSEGRNEFGPPILSKLPWINRLFKNVGYGREAESLMMMVTPRIIINEEEEERFQKANPPILGGQQ